MATIRILTGAVLLLIAGPLAAQPEVLEQDRRVLQGLGMKADGPELLDYLRRRTFKEADPKQVGKLVKELGDDDFTVREKAQRELVVLGSSALVGIKQAESSGDAEVRSRAAEIRQHIEAKTEPHVIAAAVRLISQTKPAGAAEVLLAYLPFAGDQVVVDEIGKSLGTVAVVNGTLEPAIVKALDDPMALKRGVAAEAVVRAGVKERLPAVRKLSKDPEPIVRLRVGLALVSIKDKEVLPVLVDLLGELNPEQLWPVEDLLVRLAGDDVPSVALGTNDMTKKRCREVWSAWLTKNIDKLDMSKATDAKPLLGYTLIVQQNINRIVANKRVPANGEILEVDAQKKALWRIDVPTYPVDAQVVRHDRVLVAEYQANKISERDFKGQVKWEVGVGGNPIGVQGLPNDNVFVVMQNRLVEYNRDKKEVFSLQRPSGDVFRARKLRNGEVVFITNAGLLTRMESKTQRIIKTYHVGNIPVLFGSIDLLPDGGVIVPDFQQNRVVEYDAEGKVRSSFHVQSPNSVQRLSNGHTLVASQNLRRVMEFDRAGREIASAAFNTDGMVFNARKR